MRNPVSYPNSQEITQLALDDAAALIEFMRARVEDQRLDAYSLSAAPTWTDAATAQRLAHELLHVAALSDYDATTPEETIRERVLADARRFFARMEGREQASS